MRLRHPQMLTISYYVTTKSRKILLRTIHILAVSEWRDRALIKSKAMGVMEWWDRAVMERWDMDVIKSIMLSLLSWSYFRSPRSTDNGYQSWRPHARPEPQHFHRHRAASLLLVYPLLCFLQHHRKVKADHRKVKYWLCMNNFTVCDEIRKPWILFSSYFVNIHS